MQNKKPRDMDYQERQNAFFEAYDVADPANALVNLVAAAGDFLSRIVGPDAADAGMKHIIGPLGLDNSLDWRADLEFNRPDANEAWPLGDVLFGLSAYGRYGFDFTSRDEEAEERIAARLRRRIEAAEDFLRVCPLDRWLSEDLAQELSTTVLLARARWALDHGEPVAPEALAIFGGVKMSRMRNMVSGRDAELPRDEDGLVPAAEALRWLEGRDSFFPSIWRLARANYLLGQKYELTAYEQPIFVPEARDGTRFNPGLERGGHFTIGEKGQERQIGSFEEALAELQKMPSPCWRRPGTGTGGWGIVRGATWARVSREELESEARSVRAAPKIAADEEVRA